MKPSGSFLHQAAPFQEAEITKLKNKRSESYQAAAAAAAVGVRRSGSMEEQRSGAADRHGRWSRQRRLLDASSGQWSMHGSGQARRSSWSAMRAAGSRR
nr:hypothetical protein Iba_chr15bCG9580 [Ipomoea batatas]